MHIHLPDLSGLVLVYFLVFARVGAMVMLLPNIGEAGIPARVRLVLALAISAALAPTVAGAYPAMAPQPAPTDPKAKSTPAASRARMPKSR